MSHQQLVRHSKAQYVQMVDDVSPGLMLGCLTVLACLVALILFAIVQLGGRALELGGRALELVHHIPGGIAS